MRAVVQRCLNANVVIDGIQVAEINSGLVVLVAFKQDEKEKDFDYIIKKILNLRIFEDKSNKMNLSVLDNNLEILIIPNFTIYGDARKGNRPSFIASCDVVSAKRLFEELVKKFEANYTENKIKTGVFQADMKVNLTNDGPVTIIVDSGKVI